MTAQRGRMSVDQNDGPDVRSLNQVTSKLINRYAIADLLCKAVRPAPESTLFEGLFQNRA